MSNERYGTIHRLAKDGTERGIFSECLAYCEGIIQHQLAKWCDADIIIYIRQGKVQFVEDSTKLLHDNVLVRCLESDFKNLNLDNVIAYEKTASLP